MKKFLLGALVALGVSASRVFAADDARTVKLFVDPKAGPPVLHGVAKLEAALAAQGWGLERVASPETATGPLSVKALLKSGSVPESLNVSEVFHLAGFAGPQIVGRE